MKKILIFICLYVNVAFTSAQAVIPDTSEVIYRNYNEEAINEYKVQKDYNYELDPKFEQNPIKRLWYSFLRKLMDRMGEKTLNLTWEIVKYGLIVLFLVILIRFLLRSSKTRVFKRDDKSPDFHGALIKSESGGENLNKLIGEAEEAGDYRVATSYLYLRTLRDLDNEGKIDWRDYKTNYDYEREIQDLELKSKYAILSNVFEYVVYGDLAMNKEKYTEIKGDFLHFEGNLKSTKVV